MYINSNSTIPIITPVKNFSPNDSNIIIILHKKYNKLLGELVLEGNKAEEITKLPYATLYSVSHNLYQKFLLNQVFITEKKQLKI